MTNLNLLSISAVLLVSDSAAVAEDHVTTIRWSEVDAEQQLEIGEVVVTDGEEELVIVNDTAQPLTATIATLEPTGISKFHYMVRGQIRYEDVEQPGYLEMWNHFPGGGHYFTKTMSESGPMGMIHGTSTGREFLLPFQSSPETGAPTKLEINLILPAKGKVWIGPLSVSEFVANEFNAALSSRRAWWGNRTGSLLGAFLGPVLGIMGAIVGVLSGLGRGRSVAIGVCWTAIVFGILCLAAGMIALVISQPYEVYFPMLLTGALSAGIMGGILPTIKKRFADVELQKMSAMDASGV